VKLRPGAALICGVRVKGFRESQPSVRFIADGDDLPSIPWAHPQRGGVATRLRCGSDREQETQVSNSARPGLVRHFTVGKLSLRETCPGAALMRGVRMSGFRESQPSVRSIADGDDLPSIPWAHPQRGGVATRLRCGSDREQETQVSNSARPGPPATRPFESTDIAGKTAERIPKRAYRLLSAPDHQGVGGGPGLAVFETWVTAILHCGKVVTSRNFSLWALHSFRRTGPFS
jgi:hypothetical protein